ncbi:MAG: hypothetical protein A4E53_02459 [Pelotomaculum sp. PtaB.Bin104]|nr:MAG: hypothetical protein A4E53_02459 [Pelotomaculum sp. PtaB.Bin104]
MENFIQRLDLQGSGIWFPLIMGTIALAFVILMPKRQLKWRGIYLTFGVIGYVAVMLDVFFVGEYLDVFDIGDPYLEGIGDLMSYAIIPSCLAVIFLNYFNQSQKWFHVTLFIVISFTFEWVLTQVGYMKLKGWQNYYSIPVYFVVYSMWLPWHLKLIQQRYDETTIPAPNKINESRFNINKLDVGKMFSLSRKKVK